MYRGPTVAHPRFRPGVAALRCSGVGKGWHWCSGVDAALVNGFTPPGLGCRFQNINALHPARLLLASFSARALAATYCSYSKYSTSTHTSCLEQHSALVLTGMLFMSPFPLVCPVSEEGVNVLDSLMTLLGSVSSALWLELLSPHGSTAHLVTSLDTAAGHGDEPRSLYFLKTSPRRPKYSMGKLSI